MKIPFALSSVVLAATLLAAVPAAARQLQEPRAHMVVDIPDDWRISQEGQYMRADSPDNQFQFRVTATVHAWSRGQEQQAEERAMTFVREHVHDLHIDQHARFFDWNNYVGYEIRGSGVTGALGPTKFFCFMLVDAHNPNKGVVALGLGSQAGFDRHHGGIEQALHTLRAY